MELNQIKLDPAKMETGVWWQIEILADGRVDGFVVDEPKDGEASLLIRPIGTAYQRALEKAQEPHRAAIRAGDLPSDARAQIAAQALAQAVLVDWRGLTLGGEPLSYTVEQAVSLLSEPAWLSLSEFVGSAAQHRAAAIIEEEGRAAGN